MFDLTLPDPRVLAIEADVGDVFNVHDARVRAGGRVIILVGEYLRSPDLVYDTVAPRLQDRGLLTLLRREDDRDLIIAQPAPDERPDRRSWINLVLFVATVLSTWMAGTWQALPPEALEASAASAGAAAEAYRLGAQLLENWTAGLPFMLALLGILGVHEFGHYFTARYYGLKVSLPYFIPFPLNPLTGTLGAVIRIDAPFESRKALFDVGIAGPLAGMVIAVPVTIMGLMNAELVEAITEGGGIIFQEPLLFRWLAGWIVGERPEGMDLAMNPLMMAGWWGFLVTAINLFPVSQLDGGHIAYALFGRAHKWFAWGMYGLAVLVTFSNTDSMAYVLMLGLVLLMGIQHPPALNDVSTIDRGRKILGLLTLLLFFLLITPAPLQIVGP